MDITAFRSQLKGDGARPNLFRVFLSLPTGVAEAGGGGDFASKFTLLCRASSIPGSTMGEIPLNYMGRIVNIAGNRTFTDWTVTVLNDEDFSVRRAFENWHAKLNSMKGNVRDPNFRSATSYTTDAIVEQLGKTGEDSVIATYKISAVWPSDVATIPLAWDSNDTIEEFDVTFKFDYWESSVDGTFETSNVPGYGA